MGAGQRFSTSGQTPLHLRLQSHAYTPLQAHFLHRLMRLVHLRQTSADLFEREPWLRRAVDKAIYSTFLDCAELGVGAEARLILGQRNTPSRS